MRRRYLVAPIQTDLDEKMVFVGGARQVGKTSLAKYVAEETRFRTYDYLNWDYRDDRKRILQSQTGGDSELVLFDEIHKYRDWKNYLKGLYDKHGSRFRILVTGSARLDLFRKGGDSLMGRYFYYRLHPFSVAEFLERENEIPPFAAIAVEGGIREIREGFEALLRFGGFPEPLLRQSARTLRRWHGQRLERLVREDIRDLENLRDLSAIQLLVELLPQKVGSLFSINAMREDLNAAHKTVAHWVEVLERFYYHFRIYPFFSSKIRSLRKEPKLYLWDWSEIEENDAARLENMVASHLLKLCHYLNDVEGHKASLWFLRDVEGREVDFLVSIGKKPWFAVEVKSSAKETSKGLRYFGERLNIPFLFQIVLDPGVDFRRENVRVVSADRFLASLV